MRRRSVVAACAGLSLTGVAMAAETATYIYDARGRLVRVVRSGAATTDITTEYAHDKASNRQRVRVTSASH